MYTHLDTPPYSESVATEYLYSIHFFTQPIVHFFLFSCCYVSVFCFSFLLNPLLYIFCTEGVNNLLLSLNDIKKCQRKDKICAALVDYFLYDEELPNAVKIFRKILITSSMIYMRKYCLELSQMIIIEIKLSQYKFYPKV